MWKLPTKHNTGSFQPVKLAKNLPGTLEEIPPVPLNYSARRRKNKK